MSGRFKLDPRAPDPARKVPPPLPLASKSAAPPPSSLRPPPSPSSAAAPAPRKNRRALMLAAVVVALLLVGGAVAVYVATELGYPDKYLLETSEYPAGMRTASLSASDRDTLGVRENPGQMDEEQLRNQIGGLDSETEPEEGYAQVLETSDGSRIVIVAARYPNGDDARSAGQDLRAACTFLNAAVLRDGDVLVGVFPEDASRTQVRAVANALVAKNGDLEPICGL